MPCSGFVAVLMAVALQAPATLDRILAVVNGDLITLSDVRVARALHLVPAADDEPTVVQGLIDRRLIAAEIRRFGGQPPTADAIAERRAAWATTFGGNVETVVTSLGVTSQFVDRWIAEDLRRDAYLAQRFSALEASRRPEAVRLWIESLRSRANISHRR